MYLIFWTAFDYVGAFDFEQCTHQSMIQVQICHVLEPEERNLKTSIGGSAPMKQKGLNTVTLLEPLVSGVEVVVNYFLKIVTSCFFRQELHLITRRCSQTNSGRNGN
jgi:hypothetical protein